MKEAIDYHENYDVQILSLDHDLGEDENGKLLPTGYDFVKYFCLHNLFAERIYIHTDKPQGRQAMYDTLKGAQRRGFISEHIKIHHYSITANRYSCE